MLSTTHYGVKVLLFMCTQLGRMRYATVSEFHGRKMVNIREYYEADGEIRPGRKGLCVSLFCLFW